MSDIDELNKIIKTLPNLEKVRNINVIWQNAVQLFNELSQDVDLLENTIVLFEESVDDIEMHLLFENTHLSYMLKYYIYKEEHIILAYPNVSNEDDFEAEKYFHFDSESGNWLNFETGDALSGEVLLFMIKDWLLSLN